MGMLKDFGRTLRVSRLAPHLVTDRCWADPDLDTALAAVTAQVVTDPRAATGTALAALAAVRDQPDRLAESSLALAVALAGHVDLLREVAGQSAGAERHDALGLLAGALLEQAGQARGAAWVADDGATFQRLSGEADVLLRDAYVEAPGHAAIVHQRIAALFGLLQVKSAEAAETAEAELAERYEQARAVRPQLYLAAINVLQMVSEKWYGSHELMFGFARARVTEAPPGDSLTALLPRAFCEYFLVSKDRKNDALPVMRVALGEVSAASDVLLAAEVAHPRGPAAHQMFARFFQHMPDSEDRTREHLRRGTDRVSAVPWAYTGDPAMQYAIVLEKYGVAPQPPPGAHAVP